LTLNRRFYRKEHRKGGKLCFGINGIAETDVDLHRWKAPGDDEYDGVRVKFQAEDSVC
jgi:hypothetical protein